MGREIKRVPLDFDWPKDKVWRGYLNPYYEHSHNCPLCDGSGSSNQAQMLKELWYGNLPFHPALNQSIPFTPETPQVWAFAQRNVRNAPDFYGTGDEATRREAERLAKLFNSCWGHHLNQADVGALWKAGMLKHNFKGKPTALQVNLWSIVGSGHDSTNCWICVGARCKLNHWPARCNRCKGSGQFWDSPNFKRLASRWKPQEPPKGEGYQLWETVSEGSPISPVFTTPDALADWLTTSPDYKWRSNDKGTTKEQWVRFIVGPGWAPSMIMANGKLTTGVQAV